LGVFVIPQCYKAFPAYTDPAAVPWYAYTMIRAVRLALLFVSLAISGNRAFADSGPFPPTPPVFGTEPSNTVKKWIKVEVLGTRHEPLSIVFISTVHFKTFGASLIVLPRNKYAFALAFSESWIRDAACMTPLPADIPWYTLHIVIHDDVQISQCAIPHSSACRYLSSLSGNPKIDWNLRDLDLIGDFLLRIKCTEPST
jgi:hypothetical protein